jgi:hypothetical protein
METIFFSLGVFCPPLLLRMERVVPKGVSGIGLVQGRLLQPAYYSVTHFMSLHFYIKRSGAKRQICRTTPSAVYSCNLTSLRTSASLDVFKGGVHITWAFLLNMPTHSFLHILK